MTQETTTGQNPSSHAVAGQAAAVANNLTTQYWKKKHGGYNIYEDDRIRICLDTYSPNVDVSIPAGEDREWTPVFCAGQHSTHSPQIFRPGRWIEYLARLHERALWVRTEREARREQEQAEEQTRRYAPVNDAMIYADIPAFGESTRA